jgi:carbamoyltransferase
MKNYVGLACTVHDPAVAIVDGEGKLVFAESTERRSQNKRAHQRPPDDAIEIGRILHEYVEPDAEVVIALSWKRRTWHSLAARAGFLAAQWRLSPLLRPTLVGQTNAFDLAGLNLRYRLHETAPDGPGAETRGYDHHLVHAATACWSSPYDEAVCAVIDANGESASVAFYAYQAGQLTRLDPEPLRSFGNNGSLGAFYAGLCFACGFDPVAGEEWKVMGLAPYGQKDDALYSTMRGWFRVDGLGLVANNFEVLRQFEAMRKRPGVDPMELRDLAHTGQAVFENIVTELLFNLGARTTSKNLVLTGGCALNSSFNGKVLERTAFDSLYVFCAPADDGNAIGAALLAYNDDHPITAAPKALRTPYLGSKVDAATLQRLQSLGGLKNRLGPGDRAMRRAAELIAQHKVVAVMQGRAEFGPRALGHRSILADPRSAKMKDRLNDEVKFREQFRPFAPSVLLEHAKDWFEDWQPSPYMERTLRFRPEKRERVPAVVHVDGTGRLQTVSKELSPRFHELISRFYELTSVPMVLNTSFNVMGKPIVHSVEDAAAVYFTSGIDALVIEDCLFEKNVD